MDNYISFSAILIGCFLALITGNALEKALRKIGRDDIVNRCIYNVELVTDDLEKAVAKTQLDQSGFDNLRDELGADSTRNTLQRNTSLDVSFDEQDLMKVISGSKTGTSVERMLLRQLPDAPQSLSS